MKKHLVKLSRVMALVLMLTFSFGATAAEVMVFAAASLADALKKIASNYEKKSGDKISFNFGASSNLARQIEEGAPADIFFSADEEKMDALQKKERIVPATRQSRLSNLLVIVVTADSVLQIQSANGLTNAEIKRIAFADPKTVPAGIYAKTYLEKMKLWRAVEPKVVPTDNVRGALAAVESGNVEAGMVYKTDAAISRKVKVAYEIPAKDGPEISYSMALIKESEKPQSANLFLHYLDSDEAGKVFQSFGFILQK